MQSIKEVKNVVKALRKEFSQLDKAAGDLSHNETLEMLARACGHSSWEAMRVSLEKPNGTPGSAPGLTSKIAQIGFLPDYRAKPVGLLPAYQQGKLLVSLAFRPATSQRPAFIELELSELDEYGDALEDCQYWVGCHLDPALPSEAVTEERGKYVKAVAELVAPYLSRDFGLRAMGTALQRLASGDLDACRQELERIAPEPESSDEVPVGTYGRVVALDGEEIIGTLEEVKGHAKLNTAARRKDGKLTLDYEGETIIWWDDARTQYNEAGEVLYVTASYSVVPESKVKLVSND